MRFTRSGDHVVGGLASVHVDGELYAPLSGVHAGNPQPLDDGRLICHANYLGGWRAVIANIVTGSLHPAEGLDAHGKPKGASDIFAGAGVWAVWSRDHGYRDSYGTEARRNVAGWCPLGVDDLTGTIALVTNRDNGSGLSLWNGSELTTLDASSVGPEVCFRGGVLVYRLGAALRAWRVGHGPISIAHTPLVGVRHTWPCLLLGRPLPNDKFELFLVHAADTSKGIPISASGEDFYADLRVRPDGLIEVISSPNQGDTLPVQRYRANPSTAPRVSLAPSEFALPVPNKPRLIWRGIDGSRAGDDSVKMPGPLRWGQPDDLRPFVERMPEARVMAGAALGIYLSTEGLPPGYETRQAQIVATVKEAKRRNCAVFVYSDEPTWIPRAEAMAQDCEAGGVPVVRVVQAYLVEGESAEQAIARIEAQVTKLKGTRVGLMQRADLPNPKYAGADLDRLTVWCESLIQSTPSIVVQLVFGARRPGSRSRVLAFLSSVIAAMPDGKPAPLVKPVSRPTEPDIQPDIFIQRARVFAW